MLRDKLLSLLVFLVLTSSVAAFQSTGAANALRGNQEKSNVIPPAYDGLKSTLQLQSALEEPPANAEKVLAGLAVSTEGEERLESSGQLLPYEISAHIALPILLTPGNDVTDSV